ncbi:hypothetical protein [Pleionea sediminis]|uniref:hypothetical protein n=1 Tax=Pleionea sediminis TaxID=2569479 RepID=UPI001186F008|nr:hypothetical protein [Pleionea sediminis]
MEKPFKFGLVIFSIILFLQSCKNQTPDLDTKKLSNDEKALWEELLKEHKFFKSKIDIFPPLIKDQKEKALISRRWHKTTENIEKLVSKYPNEESFLFMKADLYRQGYNLNIEKSFENAQIAVDHCIFKYPSSVSCRYTAIYLYLFFGPETDVQMHPSDSYYLTKRFINSNGKNHLFKAKESLDFLKEEFLGEKHDIEAGYIFYRSYLFFASLYNNGDKETLAENAKSNYQDIMHFQDSFSNSRYRVYFNTLLEQYAIY